MKRTISDADLDAIWTRFRASYPRRLGSNPSTPARNKLLLALQKGVDAESIISGAQAYAAEQTQLGHVGTPYVKQMVTWLNQECYRDYKLQSPFDSAALTLTWIAMGDARWRDMAARYYVERGVLPPHISGLGGQGWRFPTQWLSA